MFFPRFPAISYWLVSRFSFLYFLSLFPVDFFSFFLFSPFSIAFFLTFFPYSLPIFFLSSSRLFVLCGCLHLSIYEVNYLFVFHFIYLYLSAYLFCNSFVCLFLFIYSFTYFLTSNPIPVTLLRKSRVVIHCRDCGHFMIPSNFLFLFLFNVPPEGCHVRCSWVSV